MIDRPVVKVGDALEDTIKRLEEMAERTKAFAAEWRKWFKLRDRSANCPDHVDIDLSVDEPRSIEESYRAGENKVTFKLCALCQKAIAQAGINQALQRFGVPENMLHSDWDTYQPQNDSQKIALNTAKAYAKAPRGALILLGEDNGVGKTHLAVAVARAWAEKHKRAIFTTHPNLIFEFRKRYNQDRFGDIVEFASNVGLLILDELGLSSGGKDELPVIHQILDTRYGANKPTVLTSNLTLEKMEGVIGIRIMDRLSEYAHSIIRIQGESWRKRRRKK